MINEIRIYYECYEQARHLILPLINEVLPNTPVKLITLHSKNFHIYAYGNLLQNIFKFKVPDILLSVKIRNVEIPVLLIEFSTAVLTEDHELQRFDGYLGAVAGNCYYIKISPFKESVSAHGGRTDLDISEYFALILQHFEILSFHFEWPLKTSTLLQRDEIFLSCPPPIEDFNKLVKNILSTISKKSDDINSSEDLIKYTDTEIINLDFVKRWKQELEQYKLSPIYTKYNSSRISWQQGHKDFGNHLLFKFNRMGHAMDPERGLIWYLKYRHNKKIVSRIIFPSTSDKIFKKIKLRNDFDYLNAFIRGTGLNKNGFFINFLYSKGYLKNNNLTNNLIDITEFLENYFYILNKPLFAIFANSEAFLIQDKNENTRITLKWSYKIDPFKVSDGLRSSLLKIRDELNEDDVTYIVVHKVLQPNGFKIVNISYPGAQSDYAILPESGTGRTQKREFIDIIATLPEKYIDLTESKGKFNSRDISKDIQKLNKYLSDENYELALRTLVESIEPSSKNLPLIISVAFWSIPGSDLKSIPLNEIDFFVIITPDMKKWKIWRGGNLDIFSKLEGETELEETYIVDKKIT